MLMTDVRTLLSVIHTDVFVRTLLDDLLSEELDNIGDRAIQLFEGIDLTPDIVGLEFAATPERRAAVGYQALGWLASSNQTPEKVKQAFVYAGRRYPRGGGTDLSVDERIDRVTGLFLDPLVNFIEQSTNMLGMTRSTMARFKQRSEWFDRAHLLGVAQDQPRGSGTSQSHSVERRLVLEFARYLFDVPLELVLETQTARDQSRLDVYVPGAGPAGKMVIEAKVYDGNSRGIAHVKTGVAQAAEYAERFGARRAFLLVFNSAENRRITFSGATNGDRDFELQVGNYEVIASVINLANTLPPSRAGELTDVIIPSL